MERKIYVIGGSYGYANWMGGKIVKDMEEADLVVLTGGADINPALYGEKVGRRTWYSEGRDTMEIANYEKAKVLNKKIIGICRGAQLMTALNGGRLFQDISHYSGHIVEFENGKKVKLNSLHHQMCDPTPIKGARIIAWTDESGRSPFYYDGEDKQVAPPEKEAEIILFNQNELGIQCHPEMMSDHEEGKQEIVNLFEQFMNNTI